MPRPSLNGLRPFDAAARHLNFRRAAEALHLTQGAVAQQVRRLESDLGVRLFHRLPRGLALTEEGARYHAQVRRGLAIIDEATRGLMRQGERLTLSVPPSVAAKWLVPRLAAFTQAHPELQVETVATERLARVGIDGVDVAIRLGSSPSESGLRAELLCPLDLRAVCAPALAARIGAAASLDQLAGQALIQDAHTLWERLFTEAGLAPPRTLARFNQTALAMEAAASGQGIALAPRLLLEDELRAGRLAEVWRDPRPDRAGYHLVWSDDAGPGAASLVDWLRERVARERKA